MIKSKAKAKGFSLIELLIAMAILGILAAIAVPLYSQHVLRSNRANAKALLMEMSQRLERYYTRNSTYADLDVGDIVTGVTRVSDDAIESRRYRFDFVGDPDVTSFTLRAVPQTGQDGDVCGTMTINETGARTADQAGCW